MGIQPAGLVAVTIYVAATLMIGCGGGGGGGGNGLTSPSNATLSGTWVGTLSRPAGLPAITVRWVATHSGSSLSGPITLTNGSASLTYTITGFLEGGEEFGYNIFLKLNMPPGGASNFPTCEIKATDAAFKGVKRPVTTMTSASTEITYFTCDGFLDPPPPPSLMHSVSETTQLSLTKQ